MILIFQNGGGGNDGVLNSYCWMYSSFMIPPDFEGPCAKQEHDGSVLYNSYYQARGFHVHMKSKWMRWKNVVNKECKDPSINNVRKYSIVNMNTEPPCIGL